MPLVTRSPGSVAKILLGLGLIGCALSLYQWIELVQIRTGGATPFCSISATIDCAAIWNAPLSIWLQQHTGLPFAAWGLAYSLVCLALALRLWFISDKQPIANVVLSLRIVTGLGGMIALGLLGYSVSLGIFCPTCVLFYIFVGATVFVAYKLLSNGGDWMVAGLHSAGWLAASLLILVYPGAKTPLQDVSQAALPQISGPADTSPLAKFIQALEPSARQALSDALAVHKSAPQIIKPIARQRLTFGAENSPVHIVEWLEIRCPHCKNLHTAMAEIQRLSPPGSFSEETRYFPLDSECNTNIERTDGSGVSCLAAKILICIKDPIEGHNIRASFFEEQKTLSRDRIWDIAATNEEKRHNLEACISTPATANELKNDIDYAIEHNLEGTPMVVVNDRKAPALPLLIYSLILANGKVSDPAFAQLPPANPQSIDH